MSKASPKPDLAALVSALQQQGLLADLQALLPAAPPAPEVPRFSVLPPSGSYKTALVSCQVPGCKRQALSARFVRAILAHTQEVLAACDEAEAYKP